MDEFVYPVFEVEIGDYIYSEGFSLECLSSKESGFDWASIKLSDDDGVIANKNDEVVIRSGYDSLNTVFKGYVNSFVDNVIMCKDELVKLKGVFITATFLDVSPQEVVRYCLGMCGIEKYEISETTYTIMALFPVRNKSVFDVLREINSVWAIDVGFHFDDGVFKWGSDSLKNEDMYGFEYGENIVSLDLYNGMWELVSVATPFIRHSQYIFVDHPKITGEFEVVKVVFEVDEDGVSRSKVYFEGD